jgi:hypothetical protein
MNELKVQVLYNFNGASYLVSPEEFNVLNSYAIAKHRSNDLAAMTQWDEMIRSALVNKMEFYHGQAINCCGEVYDL